MREESTFQKHEEILLKKGYTVHKRLGAGGQYNVLLASSEESHGKCAVRVYKNPIRDLESLPRGVKEELNLAREMGPSPYFVTLFGYFFEDGCFFTTWNYAQHGSLRARINPENPLSREVVYKYLEKVARGLDELHRPDVGRESGAHGDIKPDNLLLPAPDFAIIGDLGIARLNESATNVRTTEVGTRAYSLPGVPLGKPTRERDIFGFAVTYAELRLGRHPYGIYDHEIVANLESNSPNLEGLSSHEIKLLRLILVPSPKVKSIYEWLLEISKVAESDSHRSMFVLDGEFRHVATKLESELRDRDRLQRKSKRALKFQELVKAEESLKDIREKVLASIQIRNDWAHNNNHGHSVDEIKQAVEILDEAFFIVVNTRSQEVVEPGKPAPSEQDKNPEKKLKPSQNQAHESQSNQAKPHELEPERVSTDVPAWILEYPRDIKSAQAKKYGAILKSELSETLLTSLPILFFAYGLSPMQIQKVTNLPDMLRKNLEYYLISLCEESSGKPFKEIWHAKRGEFLGATFPDWIKTYVPASQISGVSKETEKAIERQFLELNDSPGTIRKALKLPPSLTIRIGDYLAHVIAESGGRDGDLASKWGQAKGEYLLRHMQNGAVIDEAFISKYCNLDTIPHTETISVEPKAKAAQSKGSKNKKAKQPKGKKQKIDVSIPLESALRSWPQKKWKTGGLAKLTNSEKERLKKIILSDSHPSTVKAFCVATKIDAGKALSALNYAYQFILSQGGKGLSFDERLSYCKSPTTDHANSRGEAQATVSAPPSSPYPYKTQKGIKKVYDARQRLKGSPALVFSSQQKLTIRVAFLSVTKSLNWPAEQMVYDKIRHLAGVYPDFFKTISKQQCKLIGMYVNSLLRAQGWQKSNSSAWNCVVAETRKIISSKQGVTPVQVEELMQHILSWEQLTKSKSQYSQGKAANELETSNSISNEHPNERKQVVENTSLQSKTGGRWPFTVGTTYLGFILLVFALVPSGVVQSTRTGHTHTADFILFLGVIAHFLEFSDKPSGSPIWPPSREWKKPFSIAFVSLAGIQLLLSLFVIISRAQQSELHKETFVELSMILVLCLLLFLIENFKSFRKK
ncbi:protein kinase domain-containing protein [Thalassoglobus sp.]|uniref:protein kinase domain-containing protein n=1 Tax=Thalassoglobus sp. TaxID=2795869 RepID=UPI003AA7B110